MKLFEIKKKVLCGGFQKHIQDDWQFEDSSEIYLIPSFIYSVKSKTITVRFLVYDLWFRYQNDSKTEKKPF